MLAIRKKAVGCNVIRSDEFYRRFNERYAFNRWWFPYITMGIEESTRIEQVVFVENQPTGQSCLVNKGYLQAEFPENLRIHVGNHHDLLDFRAVRSGRITELSYQGTKSIKASKQFERPLFARIRGLISVRGI